MELSKELKELLESGNKIVISNVSDELLFEMLSKAGETCEINDFQAYFNTDMDYGTTYKQVIKRGYEVLFAHNKKLWVKDGKAYDARTYKPCDELLAKDEVTKDYPRVFSMDLMVNVALKKDRMPQRMYIKAYPQTITKIKNLCKNYPHGLKGIAEATMFEEAIDEYIAKYHLDEE